MQWVSLFCAGLFAVSAVALPYPFSVATQTAALVRRDDIQTELGPQLSQNASIYFPGSSDFARATERWSTYAQPNISVVVQPGSEEDVATTVRYANQKGLPFLAVNQGHGSIESLGRLSHGISIYVHVLNHITINADGESANLGGGVYDDQLWRALQAAGYQAQSGSCGCVGLMGAGLGGGHGRYEGFYGLVLDSIIDAQVVLANGTSVTVSETENSDLFWGVRGAGHNFGIVTSLNYRIYPLLPNGTWYYETYVYTQDKLEGLFERINTMMGNGAGTQPKELGNYAVYAWIPEISATEPVILFTLHYAGTYEETQQFSPPYHELGPANFTNATVPYPDLAFAIGTGSDSFLCEDGWDRAQYPVGLQAYNVTTQRNVFTTFQNYTTTYPALNRTVVVLEGYSVLGTKAVAANSTAYPHRDDNLLVSVQVTYKADETLDPIAQEFGRQTRDEFFAGTGEAELHAYVNYAFGDETLEMMYGYEQWRLDRLMDLKARYDPDEKFSWYAPIPPKLAGSA